jgi:uncharacterized phage protein (TIGR01671 family)
MSREIKFRGYDVENETMYYSNNAFHFNSPLRECDIKNAPFEINDLMQFTGLKDKNGVEIWEGDILEFVGKVYYTDACFFTDNAIPLALSEKHRVVIGNIYETPQLLKK